MILLECPRTCPAGQLMKTNARSSNPSLVEGARSPSDRSRPVANLKEQVDQPVDTRRAGRHLAEPVDQALDVLLVQRDALHDLAVHLELDRRLACHGSINLTAGLRLAGV